MTDRLRRVGITGLVGLAMVAANCSSPPDSPWAAAPDIADLPTVTAPDDGADDPTGADRSAPPTPAVQVYDDECFLDEVRCGRVAVPQRPGSPDLVQLGFRVLADGGEGTPIVELDDGTGQQILSVDDFPDRPLIVLGSRGLYPGGPVLSCPEFTRAEADDQADDVLAACIARLGLAGIDPAGTLPSQLGADVGLAITALGFDHVDLIVPGWRAPSAPAIAGAVDVRRVVYTHPWFATDRAVGPATSLAASIDAVWSHCGTTPSCLTPGSPADFLTAIASLDAAPLDDVEDTFSEEPRPIDTARLVSAILSGAGRASDLAFMPQLHQALIDRDASVVSSFIRATSYTSTEVDLLGTTCSLFDEQTTTSVDLPSPLREEVGDTIGLFASVCRVWPSEDQTETTPLPGLTVTTQSMPTGGLDHATSLEIGPVVVEPTVGAPTARCVAAAAVAWFDREEVDETACRTPLTIGERGADISLVEGTYDGGTAIVELAVPAAWSDSGFGVWWRDADPLDRTNIDVYLWDADDAEATRSQIARDWGLVEPELSSTQIGDRIWLMASGVVEIDTRYQIATATIGGHNVAIILESGVEESDRLADDVLRPALESVVVS